jgi:putative peptidoglycan lipid II flippase
MRELLKNGTNLLFRRQTNILSAAFVIMATYGLSHLIGLFKTRLLISYFFGSKAQLLDVYYAAFVIPDTIFQLLVIGSLSAAFIPVFTRLLSKHEEEAWRVARVSFNLVLLVFLAISALIFLLAHPLSLLIAPGFNPAQITIMASLLRVMLFAQLFFCVSGFLTGIIQSHQRFLIPALAPVVYNLGIIAGTVLLSPTLGIYGPAVGVVIGAVLHMVIQLPIAIKLGFRFTTRLDLHHPGVREIIHLMPPRALALGIDQIEQFVAVILASLLASGSLSLLNVARLLYALPSSLFGVTIGQAALPVLSRQAAESDIKVFRQTIVSSILQIAFLSLPVSVLFIVLRIPIVRLVFGARSFPWEATLLTGKTLAILAVSATFSAIMQLVIRGFYALQDTRTPLTVGLFAAVFDTIFSVVAVKIFGWKLLGLAVAISITTIFESLVLLFLLSRKIKVHLTEDVRVAKPLVKMLFTSFITGVSLWAPMRLLDKFVFDTTRTIPLIGLTIVTSVIGLGVYLFLSYIFRVEELYSFVALSKRISQWRQLLSSQTEPLIVPAPDQN